MVVRFKCVLLRTGLGCRKGINSCTCAATGLCTYVVLPFQNNCHFVSVRIAHELRNIKYRASSPISACNISW